LQATGVLRRKGDNLRGVGDKPHLSGCCEPTVRRPTNCGCSELWECSDRRSARITQKSRLSGLLLEFAR
jgi:hypothetical protein